MTDALTKAYSEKASNYFQSEPRRDIIDDLPAGRALTVLEVGCGGAATLALAKAQGKAARVIGVEIDHHAVAAARDKVDEIIEGNVEQMDLPFAKRSVDVVILSEILEHLFDPWLFLRRLGPCIKIGGLLYASSPNVSHISILRMLLRNRWDYVDQGRLDWTHLRWFTSQTYQEMIERAGFEVVWIRSLVPMTPKQKFANALTLNRFRHVFTGQVFAKARRLAG